MANVKTRSGVRSSPRRKARGDTKATLTTALVVDASAVLPKGATGFTSRAPSHAVQALAGKPAKVRPILQGYGEAFAMSREAGQPVSFRVDVDPSGGATVTFVEEAAADDDAYPVEESSEPGPELQQALGSVKNLGLYAASWIAGWPNCPSSTAALT